MNIQHLESTGGLPSTLELPRKDEVHFWHLVPCDSLSTENALLELLSYEETRKFCSFFSQSDAKTYGLAHGFLRKLLARYCAENPRALRFALSRRGKPSLLTDSPISFNLSHSGTHICIAVCHSSLEIGVDVECIRKLDELDGLLRLFHPGEQNYIRALPKHAQLHAFFQLWTCKEAVVKATGQGLYQSLQSFEVQFQPEVRVCPSNSEQPHCSLFLPSAFQHTSCALALIPASVSPGRMRNIFDPNRTVFHGKKH